MNYVRDAVRSHRGGLCPEDEMFDLDRDRVKVSLLKKVTEYTP